MNKDKITLHSSAYEQSRMELYDFIASPQFQKDDITKSQLAVYSGFLCLTLGETCTDNPDEAAPYIERSFVTKASNIFVAPYANPPASGVLWAYEGMQEAGFVPQTYAQGIGFYSLQPLAPIWKIFRNVSYLLLVLVVISIGFMIMFRANINPQTVIAIENAIPRIVLALILITFSFPIAGFLIDIMYVIMGLGGSIIVQNIATDTVSTREVAIALGWAQPINNANITATAGDIFNTTGWNLFGKVVGNGDIWKSGSAILSLVPYELQFTLRTVLSGVVFLILNLHPQVHDFVTGNILRPVPVIGGWLATGIGAIISFAVFGLLMGILFPLILSFFVFVTTLFLFFRIFFLLFITYTKILISIIFSPFILMFEALPERNTFAYWIKGLFFNLLTFPLVAILIMTAGMISNISSTAPLYGVFNLDRELWRPPFLYSIEANGFVMLVAISIIFLIPDMIAFVKKTFGVEDLPFNITPGKLLGGAGVALAGGMGLLTRSRSFLSEFGQYKEEGATGFGRVINFLKAENPSDSIREALQDRST